MLRFSGASLLNALEDWGHCLDSVYIVHSLGKPPRLAAEEHTAILAGLSGKILTGGGVHRHRAVERKRNRKREGPGTDEQNSMCFLSAYTPGLCASNGQANGLCFFISRSGRLRF